MNSPTKQTFRRFATVLAIALIVSAPTAAQSPSPTPAKPSDPAIPEFQKRVDTYVAIHVQAEKALPALSKEATPQEIDSKQRALAVNIQAARTGAKRGDIFTPEMTAFIKSVMKRVFSGPEGAKLRMSVMDENVKYLPVKVNQRYPDEYPRATMPSDVLKALPELPEEMEYRFIGSQLILLDQHAHIIPDFIPAALPAK